MNVLQTRLHAGVMPTDTKLRVRHQRGPHLASGELDAAEGVCAVWSALIVLGSVTRDRVTGRRFTAADDALADTWRKGLEMFYAGNDADAVMALLETVDHSVRSAMRLGSMRTMVEFVVERLRMNEIVLLFLDGEADMGGRCTLAVGLEDLVSDGLGKAIGILCIDASEPAPQLSRFNARLELNVPQVGATYVRYRGSSGSSKYMTIASAISLVRQAPSGGRPGRRDGAAA